MAARRLRLWFAIEFALYCVLIAAIHLRSGASLAVLFLLLPIVMLAARASLVLASFAIASIVTRTPALGAKRRLRMLMREFSAFLQFQWLIATRPRNDWPIAATDPQAPIVVLLHGILCNGAIWRPLVTTLRQRTGCGIRTPDLEPGDATLDEQARVFAAWLKMLATEHRGRDIVIVAHSLGGLVARCALRQEFGARIRLICIGTPHRGSRIARYWRSPIGRDLCVGSTALASLENVPEELLNIHSPHDNLVVPAQGCEVEGARNRTVIGCGHMSLIYSRAVIDMLCAEIGSVQAATHASAFT